MCVSLCVGVCKGISVIGAYTWLSARGTCVCCVCASMCVNVQGSQCYTYMDVCRCVNLESMCLSML